MRCVDLRYFLVLWAALDDDEKARLAETNMGHGAGIQVGLTFRQHLVCGSDEEFKFLPMVHRNTG